MNLIQTYSIEDCISADMSTYTSSSSANIVYKYWQLPNQYKITFEMYGATSNGACDIQIGAENGNKVALGYVFNPTNYQIWRGSVVRNSQYTLPDTTSWVEQEVTVNNRNINYWDMNYTPSADVDMNTFASIVCLHSKIRNVKIKPL